MLTKSDLRWNYKFLSVYSKLNLIPVSLKSGIHSGQMENHGKSQIWRLVGFKLCQILCHGQNIVISCRTLHYASGGMSEGVRETFDWDFLPIMVVVSGATLAMDFMAHRIFDSGREMNIKINNETLKLCGKVF